MRAAAAALLLLLAGCASPGRSIELTAEQAALCEQEGGTLAHRPGVAPTKLARRDHAIAESAEYRQQEMEL